MERIFPKQNHSGRLGLKDKVWAEAHIDKVVLPQISAPAGNPDTDTGWLYVKDSGGTPALFFEDDGGTATQIATTPTAFDDIGDPDAAGTIQFGTFAQTITSTKTDGDMLTIQGLGAFGDVSVVRIEQKTGNATDGTVLEVVAADANVDPLVVSSSAQTNALVVGQNAGNVAVAAGLTVGGAATVTGLVTATGGLSAGSASNSLWKTDTIELSNANIKALHSSPIALVAAPGADKVVEFGGAVLILDYGSNVLSESADNLVIQYNTSGVDASAVIETTGFIDQTADMIAFVVPSGIAGFTASNCVNRALELYNNGDSEFGGNAANDTTMTVKVTYRIHTVGLA